MPRLKKQQPPWADWSECKTEGPTKRLVKARVAPHVGAIPTSKLEALHNLKPAATWALWPAREKERACLIVSWPTGRVRLFGLKIA
jgi:hypothetical protein